MSRPSGRPSCSSQIPELVLASRSPQRRAILEQLGIEFRVETPDARELTEGDPRALVEENARRKAGAVEGELVLGVDTVVVLGEQVIGKPSDEQEARSHLESLSGTEHEVWSGICLAGELSHAVTRVRFRALSGKDIEWYLRTQEWRERAGGYAIQGRGAVLVESIAGDYWNVVGLPVAELSRMAPALVRNSHG